MTQICHTTVETALETTNMLEMAMYPKPCTDFDPPEPGGGENRAADVKRGGRS